jgi:hypothetical protein
MEIKKIGSPPTKIHWSEGALFEVRLLQMLAENFLFLSIFKGPLGPSLPCSEFGIREF